MSLSIIIVTYNSANFISLCLKSAERLNIEKEIIVVDNNSTDATTFIIQKYFPEVHLSINKENLGFSKGCNIGASIASESNLLFLNPDTLIPEESILLMLDHLQKPGVGAVGGLLIDGSGKVLPESARELPSTKSGIYKFLGLAQSKGHYYYRDINFKGPFTAPVLSGACMMLRTEVYQEVGGFDERFFMYGEDIELSAKIIASNRENYCLGNAPLLHFKGESTRKHRFSYNYHFFRAIDLYNRKNPIDPKGWLYQRAVRIASMVLTLLSFFKNVLAKLMPSIVDLLLIVSLFLLIQFGWSYTKEGYLLYFGKLKFLTNYIIYGLIYVLFFQLNGLYSGREIRIRDIFKSSLYAGVSVLVVYALLPLNFRFSRVVLMIGVVLIPIFVFIKWWLFTSKKNNYRKVLVTNNREEIDLSYLKLAVHETKSIDEIEFSNYEDRDLFIFDIASLNLSRIAELIRGHERKFQFLFLDKELELGFESSQSRIRGRAHNEMAHYNLAKRKFVYQKRLIEYLFLVVLFIPVIFVFPFFKEAKMNGFRNVFYGRLHLIGYVWKDINRMDIPIMKPPLMDICVNDKMDYNKVLHAKEYAANYTIFEDIIYLLKYFRSVIKLLAK